MKRNLLLTITVSMIAGFLNLELQAQNLVTGGNMEDQNSWSIYNAEGNNSDPVYTFNYTNDRPSAGEGGCLWISGQIDPGGEEAIINSYCYQSVTVMAGTTYRLTAAFKDVSSEGLYNFWCELGLSPYNTADSMNTGAHMMLAMNTFDQCGSGLDGTFQDDDCKYTGTGGGKYYKIPDEPAGEQTYYLFIQTGSWDNSSSIHTFDVLLDEFVLMDSISAGGEPESVAFLTEDGDMFLNSYPNPARGTTTMSFYLPESSQVKISLCNLLGEEVFVVSENEFVSGIHSAEADLSGLESGIYFIVLKTHYQMRTYKLVIE